MGKTTALMALANSLTKVGRYAAALVSMEVDRAPAEVYATLLDERGRYVCSIRTVYRVLAENAEVRERRRARSASGIELIEIVCRHLPGLEQGAR